MKNGGGDGWSVEEKKRRIEKCGKLEKMEDVRRF
jgi:hypothetical protein